MSTVVTNPSSYAAEVSDPGYLASLVARLHDDVVLAPADFGVRTIRWGEPWMYESPAYWVARAEERLATDLQGDAYSLGENLVEEVVACLLGGFGVTYELNVAAFNAVRDAGMLDPDVAPDHLEILGALQRPLALDSGRTARYRFPNQKSSRIAAAIGRLRSEQPPADPFPARDWLLSFKGIGPKTASWIVRNRWPEAEVAIVDIHVWRAATACGVFAEHWTPSANYWEMEAVFVEWARHGGVTAAALDATIWAERAARARRPSAHSRPQ
ncbi:hypothetical protein HQQ81_22255 [Microbacteriaceae bacterium VKM Ac-2854]|nr:hypothetical protein [Microbacteriaceae bacterium VKM Ac-2854]